MTLLTSAVALADDGPGLGEPPDGFHPAAHVTRVMRYLAGRVVGSSPGADDAAVPTEILERGARSPTPLPWNASAPPCSRWNGEGEALCGVDDLGRLIVAVDAHGPHRTSLAAARFASSRFGSLELAWASFALDRLRSDRPASEIHQSAGAARNRWLELLLRLRPGWVEPEHVAAPDVPPDLLRLAWNLHVHPLAVAAESARRGERPDLDVLRRDPVTREEIGLDPGTPVNLVAALLRAGDARARAVVLRWLAEQAGGPECAAAAEALFAAGPLDDAEFRAALAPHIRKGHHCVLWTACGGTVRELLGLRPDAAELCRERIPGPPSAEAMALVVACEQETPEAKMKRAAAIAGSMPDSMCAAALAAFDSVGALSDPAADTVRLAVRARLGDAAAAEALTAIDWWGPAPGAMARYEVRRLLARARGTAATRALVRVLIDPPFMGGCGNMDGGDDTRPPEDDGLAGRTSEEIAAGLAALDDPAPAGADRASVMRLRWRLGRPPTLAQYRQTGRSGRAAAGDLPRGAWGPEENELRVAMTQRGEWRDLLALDGKIPDAIVQRALRAADVRKPGRDEIPLGDFDALRVLGIVRPPGAREAALRIAAIDDRLARSLGFPGVARTAWATVGRLTPATQLRELAVTLCDSAADVRIGPGREADLPEALGFLAALAAAADER